MMRILRFVRLGFAWKSFQGPAGQVGVNPDGVSEIRRETPLRRSNGKRLRQVGAVGKSIFPAGTGLGSRNCRLPNAGRGGILRE